jgi:hypothetical protein
MEIYTGSRGLKAVSFLEKTRIPAHRSIESIDPACMRDTPPTGGVLHKGEELRPHEKARDQSETNHGCGCCELESPRMVHQGPPRL